MISKIEQALIQRLHLGLGKLVYSVGSYSGEIDDSQLDVRRLPACLVSYAGSDFEAKAMGRSGGIYQANDTFVVLVMTRSMRSSEASRIGGVTSKEIGVNALITAVKYLLVNQTLGGLVQPIQPKRIRTIWNNAEVRSEKLSAFAIEFQVRYTQRDFLDDGRFPEGINELEAIFKQYQGKLDEPYPDLERVQGQVFDPHSNAKVSLVVNTSGQKSE